MVLPRRPLHRPDDGQQQLDTFVGRSPAYARNYKGTLARTALTSRCYAYHLDATEDDPRETSEIRAALERAELELTRVKIVAKLDMIEAAMAQPNRNEALLSVQSDLINRLEAMGVSCGTDMLKTEVSRLKTEQAEMVRQLEAKDGEMVKRLEAKDGEMAKQREAEDVERTELIAKYTAELASKTELIAKRDKELESQKAELAEFAMMKARLPAFKTKLMNISHYVGVIERNSEESRIKNEQSERKLNEIGRIMHSHQPKGYVSSPGIYQRSD